jgi:signal peptidase I
MKKRNVVLLVLAGIIVVAGIIASVTGMLRVYNIPATSNEPTIKRGNKIFVSNLKAPRPYHFIVFKSRFMDSAASVYMPEPANENLYVHRLCGKPGDVLKMKNGVLFVNNKNFDELLNLKKQYKIKKEDLGLIEEADMPEDDFSNEFIVEGDSGIVTFDNVLYKKYAAQIKLTPYFINDTSATAGCFKWMASNTSWTADNFGPLKIPGNCYFVLGDNRHNAQDSRYAGFVSKNNIKGVVLGK